MVCALGRGRVIFELLRWLKPKSLDVDCMMVTRPCQQNQECLCHESRIYKDFRKPVLPSNLLRCHISIDPIEKPGKWRLGLTLVESLLGGWTIFWRNLYPWTIDTCFIGFELSKEHKQFSLTSFFKVVIEVLSFWNLLILRFGIQVYTT